MLRCGCCVEVWVLCDMGVMLLKGFNMWGAFVHPC